MAFQHQGSELFLRAQSVCATTDALDDPFLQEFVYAPVYGCFFYRFFILSVEVKDIPDRNGIEALKVFFEIPYL